MSILDIAVVLVYLAALAGMAVYCARGNTTTEEYFLGGRSFPGWAVGLSMVGTAISSVTFLALPAAAYELDWRQFVSHLPVPLVAVLAAVVFIPIFRHRRRTTAFEYLEQRFGPLARLYGAVSFIVLQLIRVATVLYLVAIPISLAAEVHIIWVIVLAGAIVSGYTIAGGIAAVIWTDVVQSVVLISGGLFCVVTIAFSLPGGLQQVVEVASSQNKFALGSFSAGLSERTFWAVLTLGAVAWLNNYTANQNVVQRYLASASLKEARKATFLAAAVNLPVWAAFFFLGTALFVFYQVFPDERVANSPPDSVLPYFILSEVPLGLRGLLVAAVLSAAMSSLDSSINAVSAVVVTDIFQRYSARPRTDRGYLRLGRGVSLATSCTMVCGAVLFHFLPKETMFDVALIAGSLFGGCLAAMFALGFCTTRVDYRSTLVALVVAVLVNLYFMCDALQVLPASLSSGMHVYWAGMFVNLAFLAVAYPLSWLRGPGSRRDLDGLTVWTT